jgi:DNA mismatch repair protein MutS2
MNATEIMDAHTLELLEFGKVRELVAGYAASSLGKELAREIEPSTDLTWIRNELTLVGEMVDALVSGQAPPLTGLRDVRLLVRRAAIGSMLTAEQLLEVADTLNCTGNMYRYRMRLSSRLQRLIEMLTPIEDLGGVARTISGSIDTRGHVLDMASRDLALVRQKLNDLDERVKERINRLLRDPELRKILRYPNATVSGDHYVLPVAVNHRHKVPGVVHRTSSTGETLFVEPAAVAALSAERAVLKGEEEREIRRVLRRLTAEVGRVAKPLSFAIDLMARVDLITAKAQYSRAYHHYPPDVNGEGKLWLRQARHPILEHLFRNPPTPGDRPAEEEGAPTGRMPVPGDQDPAAENRTVVPIDVRLGIGFNLLIITGPNTGGKTVCLKTTGLLCLMAHAGMHLPAGEGSQVPLLHHILADIGDEQSLEQSLSTFSSHISRIAYILQQADEQSLVLLDELGAGTDPTEGAALGRAILDTLDQTRCRAIVTTHLGDLKTYAFNNERAENGAVEFDVETLRPTYRLHIGQFGMSNALRIARRLKMPRDLLSRAHKYLRRKQKKGPELVRLQQLREEAEKARAEALKAQHEADRQRAEYEARQTELARQAEADAALKEARGRLKPRDRVRVPRFDKVGQVVRVDHKRNTVMVSVGLGQWEVPLDEVFPVAEGQG